MTDFVLIIGKQQDIGADYTYDTSLMEAFLVYRRELVPKSTEPRYYAPCHVEDGWLPVRGCPSKGTNTDMEPLEIKNKEDGLLLARNKWLIKP